jgi:glutathione peroxidase
MARGKAIKLLRNIGASAVFSVLGLSCSKEAPRTPEDLVKWSDESLWSIQVVDIDGEERPLSAYQGKVALIVNVASKCGFTPQYQGLQALYESRDSNDFVILGFPCNDFGSQEAGSESDITEFCSTRYGVTFPMFEKIQIKSDQDRNDVYSLLGTQTGKLPGWNFCKYVVGRDGKAVAFFQSNISPASPKIQKAIDQALSETPESGLGVVD